MQVGRYQIIERLGAGGMGVVYRAMALGVDGFKKPVVIKRIHGHLAERPEVLRRFVNEAKIAMSMSHGNVVQVLDLGRMGNEYFIALEYVDGRDLRTLLKRCLQAKDWLPREISLLIVSEVLRGLDYAHRRTDPDGRHLGVVHRDVTPANILCSFEGEVKLTDFGIARALAWAGSTQVGAIRGSIKYMSPEQAWGHEVDQRSDIFSVGAILYLLLCRAHPFPGTNMDKVLDQVREASYPLPSARGVQLPEELETVLLTAMAKEPDDRYRTAAAMLAALENYQRTIPHATSSDLQALMQRLFEHELERRSEAAAAKDGLVGARIDAAAASNAEEGGVSVYSVTGGTTTPTTPATPRGAGRDAGDGPDSVLEPDPDAEPLLATRPGIPEDSILSGPAAALRRGGRLWLLLGAVLLLLAGLGLGLWLFRPSQAPAPSRGVLVVKTEPPGAEVMLGGVAQGGRSPVVLSDLARGRSYHVAARLEDHAPAETRVTLDKATRTVTLKLRRTMGRVRIMSEPAGAQVVVQGEARGTTPTQLALPLDTEVAVTLEHPDRRVWTDRLTLTAAKPRRFVMARLQPRKPTRARRTRAARPKTGWVRISTRPAYAEVFVGGRRVDTTPCRIKLPLGAHQLRLVNPRLGVSVTHKVVVRGDKEAELTVDNFE